MDPMMDFAMEDWRQDAACSGMDPDMFFPAEEASAATAHAVAICGGCQVRDECLTYAIEARMTAGVWGGLTASQRKGLRRAVTRRRRRAS